MAPSTRSFGYRCSVPSLAGFTSIPSPGTAFYLAQNARWVQRVCVINRAWLKRS